MPNKSTTLVVYREISGFPGLCLVPRVMRKPVSLAGGRARRSRELAASLPVVSSNGSMVSLAELA
jgi:hypothetical protein